jgi:hypothetical protein
MLVLLQYDNDGFSVPVVFRGKAQCAGNGHSPCQAALQRGSGTPQERPKGWSVSAHGGVTPLGKDRAIACEACLALDADKPTEPIIIILKEY